MVRARKGNMADKPHIRVSETRKLKCLQCNKTFDSYSKFNRRCHNCKASKTGYERYRIVFD